MLSVFGIDITIEAKLPQSSASAELRNDWAVVAEFLPLLWRKREAALEFTNRVGDLAEEQGHHPDIYLAWGRSG